MHAYHSIRACSQVGSTCASYEVQSSLFQEFRAVAAGYRSASSNHSQLTLPAVYASGTQERTERGDSRTRPIHAAERPGQATDVRAIGACSHGVDGEQVLGDMAPFPHLSHRRRNGRGPESDDNSAQRRRRVRHTRKAAQPHFGRTHTTGSTVRHRCRSEGRECLVPAHR